MKIFLADYTWRDLFSRLCWYFIPLLCNYYFKFEISIKSSQLLYSKALELADRVSFGETPSAIGRLTSGLPNLISIFQGHALHGRDSSKVISEGLLPIALLYRHCIWFRTSTVCLCFPQSALPQKGIVRYIIDKWTYKNKYVHGLWN